MESKTVLTPRGAQTNSKLKNFLAVITIDCECGVQTTLEFNDDADEWDCYNCNRSYKIKLNMTVRRQGQ